MLNFQSYSIHRGLSKAPILENKMRYFSFDSLGTQTTFKKCFEIEGKAMVSGKKVIVKCTPAKANVGIVFIVNGSIIKAIYSNLVQSNFYTTVLEESGNKIMTTLWIFWAICPCLDIEYWEKL